MCIHVRLVLERFIVAVLDNQALTIVWLIIRLASKLECVGNSWPLFDK